MKYPLRIILAIIMTIIIPIFVVLRNFTSLIYHCSTEYVEWEFNFTFSDTTKTSGGMVRVWYDNWFTWAIKHKDKV